MAVSDKTNEIVVKTITRWINEISSSANSSYEFLLNTTLNSKYNVFQTEEPQSVPKLMYFGLGINGFYNVDDGNLSAPYYPAADELDLYEPIPLRCVPVAEDLSSAERAQYRMRVEKTVNGERYYCYYLKCLSVMDNVVKLTRTNPISKEEEPFELSASKLTPTPRIPTTSGEVEGTITEVNASLALGINWMGSEVLEAINVLYNGDMRRAKISEIGIYSGEDREVNGYNSNSETLRYTESIYTQLAYKICNIGSVVTSPTYDGSRQLHLTNSSTLLM